MKKIFITFLCIIALLSPTFAQHQHSDLHNEIGFTAGPMSLMGGIIYGSVGFWNAIGSSFNKSAIDMNLYGQYGMHYYYQVKPWCQVGVKLSYEGCRLTHYTDTLRSAIKSQNHMALISVMPSVRFTYLNRPWVRLYSGFDAGCSYYLDAKDDNLTKAEEEKDNNFIFAFNVSAFGVNVGKKFFGMFEINLGYSSYVVAGIGARF